MNSYEVEKGERKEVNGKVQKKKIHQKNGKVQKMSLEEMTLVSLMDIQSNVSTRSRGEKCCI